MKHVSVKDVTMSYLDVQAYCLVLTYHNQSHTRGALYGGAISRLGGWAVASAAAAAIGRRHLATQRSR